MLAPGNLSRVLFSPGGTSAIGMAMKLARYATGRHKTISMWGTFHGASLDAISIGMVEARHERADGRSLFTSDVALLYKCNDKSPKLGFQVDMGKMQKCRLHHYALGFASRTRLYTSRVGAAD